MENKRKPGEEACDELASIRDSVLQVVTEQY